MTASDIKAKARSLGFDLCGIAPAADLPELTFLREWLDRGYGGTMTHLHRFATRRADARNVLPSPRAVIVTATNYHTHPPSPTEAPHPSRPPNAGYPWAG